MTNADDRQVQLLAQGWTTKPMHGFNDHVGAVWARRDGDDWVNGFVATEKHLNNRGVVHGGMLATFADTVLGRLVGNAVKPRPTATIQLNMHYIAPVAPGDFVEGRGAIVRVTGSLVFVTGRFEVGSSVVATADGVWKILRGGGSGSTGSEPDRLDGSRR